MRPSLSMRAAICAVLLPCVALACETRAPSVPRRDTGTSVGPDGSPNIVDAGYHRREGGPRLPAADIDLTLPYLGPPSVFEVEGRTDVATLDVFLSIDTTASFGGEIDELQRSLIGDVLPALEDRVPSVGLGVGRFEDFPVEPFGASGDAPFRLITPITNSRALAAEAIASLDAPLGNGGDFPESGAEALYQIATGVGYRTGARVYVRPFSSETSHALGTLGGVGFRREALRVVVHVTDAVTHRPADYQASFRDTRSLEAAALALRDLGVRALSVVSGPEPRSELESLAITTGAVIQPQADGCHTGVNGSVRGPLTGMCPLVFDVDPNGSGLSQTIVTGIGELLDEVVWHEVWAQSDDSLGFVQQIEAIRAQPGSGTPPIRQDLRPAGDSVFDTFVDVRPETRVTFAVTLANRTIEPADYDQVFNLELSLQADDTELSRTTVRVTVPRGRLDGGQLPNPDASDS